MLLLAIDSAQRQGSISLARDDGGACEIIAGALIEGGTFSSQFIPQLSRLLRENNLTKEQMECFACASGPGSFTGLRVGLAAIKALAEVLGRPIVPVSTLEMIASGAGGQHEFVISALDAGRGDVYVGEYHRKGVRWRAKREFLATAEEFAAFLRGFDVAPLVVTPEERVGEASRLAGALDVQVIAPPTSETVARLAFLKFAAGETVTVDELESNYVRGDMVLYAK